MAETETTLLVKKQANDASSEEKSPVSEVSSSLEQPKFSSKLGIMLTSIGCAVGTGNVWRFPRMVANNSGENGGLQFLLVWVAFLFLWSMPLIILEYAVGRFTKKAAPMTFYRLLGVKTTWLGCWINMINFLVGSYYSVLVGYTLFYMVHCMFFPLPTTLEESQAIWRGFVDESSLPVATHFVITLGCAIIIWRGVESIELVMKVMVPGLLVLVLVVLIWALTLTGAWQGVVYLFTPDWEILKSPRLWVDALSQNAVDTSAGWGQFLVLGTSMAANQGAVQMGVVVPTANNAISLISAAMIFAAVFSMYTKLKPGGAAGGAVKLLKENGPANTGLTFIWMPILFSFMAGGRVIASLFFLALAMAGVSSYVTMINTSVQPLVDLGVKREVSVVLLSILSFLLGIPSALSPKVLANQDFVWGASLIFSGLMLVYLFWRYGSSDFRVHLVNQAGAEGGDWKVPKAYEWLVKFVLPVEGTVVVVWWVVDTVQKETISWYEIGLDTLMTAILEWAGLLILLVGFNVILCFFQPQISRWWRPVAAASHDSFTRCCRKGKQGRKEETGEISLEDLSLSSQAKNAGYNSL
ncbi:SLC6A11 [Branchiostoma lanceolatum]|uniref:SLC6A11 protein n=1 Tax=Branchiostoma lanceolatum TaxID=7740 RepID=A0A8J9Z564_BRALA|nr:SLC6A11 [Branchiostoma lanceolatum]